MSLLLFGVQSSSVFVPGVAATKITSEAPAVASVTYEKDGGGLFTDGGFRWYSIELLNIGVQYEILAEVNTAPSTTSFSGTIGTWLSLSENRTWSLSKNAGSDSGALQISIRKAGETQVIASGTVGFLVEIIT